MNKIIFAHLALFIVNLIYALNYSIAKDVMPEFIKPSGFILLRVSTGVFLFFIFFKSFINEKINRSDIIRFSACGLFGVAINQLFFFEGLSLTTPINAAIIMTTNPILVIVISAILLRDKISLRKIIGIIFGFIGACNLILNSGDFSFNNNFLIGNFLVFINATSYALYLVLVKDLMNRYHPITVMFYVFLFGLIFVMPFGYENLMLIDLQTFTNEIYLKVLFVIIFTTFIAYLFNGFALKSLTPSTVSVYIYLQPLLASLIALSLNVDTLDIQKIISTCFIFTAVFLVSLPQKKVKTD